MNLVPSVPVGTLVPWSDTLLEPLSDPSLDQLHTARSLEERVKEEEDEEKEEREMRVPKMNSKRQKTQENMSSAIIINPFRESYEPQVNIHSHFTSILKPHQIEGIQYMWKRVVSNNLGGILAHSMGLDTTNHCVYCDIGS
ncbi:hypothetical protein BDF14DRAFT_592204 [Spinellus fusiger]|nr:hypothetical protein BDF14DRAFT_592204 [Spinellus fusiger]